MKKFLCLFCSVALSITLLAPTVSAQEWEDEANVYYGVDSNAIIIDSLEDLDRLNQQAIAEYNRKIAAIPDNLKEDFSNFYNEYREKNAMYSKSASDSYYSAFLEEYPEYKGADQVQLQNQISTLQSDTVVSAVRAFFTLYGYDLSLTLFNHSLTDNPADAVLVLTGNTGGMYSHIRGLLHYDDFTDLLDAFAKAGTSREIKEDSKYAFENGDLYWSIHGFTWRRMRVTYDRATFSIIDKYDFNKWQDIPGIVAGLAGTNDFDVVITGEMRGGIIQ